MEITVREAAKLLGVVPSRVWQLILAGRVKSRLLNPRMRMIDKASVLKLKRNKGR